MSAALRTSLFLAGSVSCLWSQQSGSASKTTTLVVTNSMLAGMVMMEDGSPVPASVDIKLACNGSERTVTHSGVNDDFAFQWTGAAQPGTVSGINSFTNTMSGANSDAASVFRSSVPDQSGYCDLRASLPGYRSSEINLNGASAFESTNVASCGCGRSMRTRGTWSVH